MAVSIRREGDLAVVTVDNPPVNAVSHAVRQGLLAAVTTLDDDPAITGVILVCAGRTFIAGADVTEFGKPPLEPHLRDVVAAIERAQKPWIAAIHGTALGGGFEIAMGCRFRVALKDAKIGLPEVMLGLIPGAGGTVRTSRLTAVEDAVELVTSGRPIGAVQACAMELIDAVFEGDLLSSTQAFAHDVFAKELPPPVCARPVQAATHVDWAEIEQRVQNAARGEGAPLYALASIRNACAADFASALAFERNQFLALRASPQAAALRAVFFAERAALRPKELVGIEPRRIKNVGMFGGGAIADAIAAVLRDCGFTMIRSETEPTACSHADLVIEATNHAPEVKQMALVALGQTCRADAILATTLSAFDLSTALELATLAVGVPHPNRFIGIHFSDPSHAGKLLEILPVAETANEVVAAAFALARGLDKIPIRSGTGHGFISQRLLHAMRTQVERLRSLGVTLEQIEGALREFGFTMMPFMACDTTSHFSLAPVASAHPAFDPSPLTTAEMVETILLSIVNEGAQLLGEGIAAQAADIDLVAIHGLGWPRRSGGPMHWVSARSLSEGVAQLDRLAASGFVESACDLMRRAAETGRWPSAAL